MDLKNKLSNVSFGGNWSEELLEFEKLDQFIADLEWAVENCTQRPVDSPSVAAALEFVKNNVEKAPMLVERFHRAMKNQNRSIRKAEMTKIHAMIRTAMTHNT